MLTAEAGLLRIVSSEDDALCLVSNAVGRDGWVMGDLFYHQGSLPTTFRTLWPVTVEQSESFSI